MDGADDGQDGGCDSGVEMMNPIKEIQDPKNRLQIKDIKKEDPQIILKILYGKNDKQKERRIR